MESHAHHLESSLGQDGAVAQIETKGLSFFSGSVVMAARYCRISIVVLWLPCQIRASGIVGSASPISRVAPDGRYHFQRCIRRHRRLGRRDHHRAVQGIDGQTRSRGGVEQAAVGNQLMLLAHDQRYLTKRLHPAPRQGLGVWYFVTLGFSVRRVQERFQNNSHFAARVSRGR